MYTTTWQLAHGRTLDLSVPRIVAILNVTPDSFSDGGIHNTPDLALAHAVRCLAEGADVLEVGGESTRPGAERVGEAEQVRRLVPVIGALRARFAEVPIAVDTTLAGVARRAIEAGADIINDVSAGEEDAGMLALAAQSGAGLVLMHRLRPPGADRYSDRYDLPPEYGDVVHDVREALAVRYSAAISAGVRQMAVVLDPGLGFGKSVAQNLELIRRTNELCAIGPPIMSAASRKSFVGRVSLGRDSQPGERLAGSVAVTVLHALAGARLFRVHDVGAHAEALRMVRALAGGPGAREAGYSRTTV